MEWFTEPFALGFQQRALLGGVLAAVMTSVVGTWLVLRGMSFFGDAFVHGVIPGIAAAVVLDLNPLVGAAVAAAVMVFAIELVNRQTVLGEDTSIGLLFVGMLALGVVIISRLDSYSGSLTSILFGDALGVTASDLVGQAILTLVVVGVALPPSTLVEFQRGEGGTMEHEAQKSPRCSACTYRRCGHRKLSIRRYASRVRSSDRSTGDSEPHRPNRSPDDAVLRHHRTLLRLAGPDIELPPSNCRIRHHGAGSDRAVLPRARIHAPGAPALASRGRPCLT